MKMQFRVMELDSQRLQANIKLASVIDTDGNVISEKAAHWSNPVVFVELKALDANMFDEFRYNDIIELEMKPVNKKGK